MMSNNNNNNIVYTFILITFVSFATVSFLHDPTLHSIPALVFGWSVNDWYSTLTTGETIVTTDFNPTIIELWIFFMMPAIFLIWGAIIISLYLMNRVFHIFSIISIMLNFASLDPSLVGSDSNKAMSVLIENGIGMSFSIALHYGLFLFMIVSIGIYLFIIFEDNPRDSERRVKRISPKI